MGMMMQVVLMGEVVRPIVEVQVLQCHSTRTTDTFSVSFFQWVRVAGARHNRVWLEAPPASVAWRGVCHVWVAAHHVHRACCQGQATV